MANSRIDVDKLDTLEEYQMAYQSTLDALRQLLEKMTNARGRHSRKRLSQLDSLGETFAALGMHSLIILSAQETLLQTYKKLYGNLSETDIQEALNEAGAGNFGEDLGRTGLDS